MNTDDTQETLTVYKIMIANAKLVDSLKPYIGKYILFICNKYFYAGTLIKVEDGFCTITDIKMIYEGGRRFYLGIFGYHDKVPGEMNITFGNIESFMLVPNVS